MPEREVTGPEGPATTTNHHANDDAFIVGDVSTGAEEDRGWLIDLADSLLADAVELAEHHWRVFPLAPLNKTPRIPNPHPPRTADRAVCKGECGQLGHGLHDATDDIDTVTNWWSGQYALSNIGCRIPDPMLMLDIDPRHGGDVRWAELEKKYGKFPDCMMTLSGRGDGGSHRYFLRPPGRITARRLGPGIDLKTSAGYAVMPRSVHPDSGKPYLRIDGPIPPPSEWFVDLATEVAPARTDLSRVLVPSGNSPADAFCVSVSWAQVLEPHGWVCLDLDPDEDGSRWLHPDATSACSATIRHRCLFVYSTNTPFDVTEAGNPKGYTKFRAYAVLYHNGDLRAAASAIMKGAAR